MKAKLVSFGEIVIEGEHYDHDVVIDRGRVRKRKKKPSKPYRDRFGHTPLSVEEDIPWNGRILYVGTGAYGALPVMQEVYDAAGKQGFEVVARPTAEVCKLVEELSPKNVNAVLHVTC